MPLLRRRRVLAAKLEAEVGTAETLAAADAAMNVFESVLNPDTEFIEREGQGGFSPLPGTLGAYGGTVTFQTEWHGPGSALWATVLLPCCGWVSGAGGYSPVSRSPGNGGVQTCTIGLFEDGILKRLRGCMGTAVITCTSGQKVMMEWTFTGVWADPQETALITPTYPTVKPCRFANVGLTLGEWEPKFQELTFDMGNEVVLREDANSGEAGYISAVITGRRITGTMNPEATLVSANDVYGDWLNLEEQELDFSCADGDGNTVSFNTPKLQFTNVQEADRDNIQTDDIEFQLNRDESAGDDEATISFATPE